MVRQTRTSRSKLWLGKFAFLSRESVWPQRLRRGIDKTDSGLVLYGKIRLGWHLRIESVEKAVKLQLRDRVGFVLWTLHYLFSWPNPKRKLENFFFCLARMTQFWLQPGHLRHTWRWRFISQKKIWRRAHFWDYVQEIPTWIVLGCLSWYTKLAVQNLRAQYRNLRLVFLLFLKACALSFFERVMRGNSGGPSSLFQPVGSALYFCKYSFTVSFFEKHPLFSAIERGAPCQSQWRPFFDFVPT